jgi:hypothetical protein
MTTEVGSVRTYEPVRIKFGQAREIFQKDCLSGRTIDRDEATETIILLGATLDLRGLSQGFEVRGIIEQKSYDKEKLAAKVRAAVVAGLPKRAVIHFFRPTEIVVTPENPELDAWEKESQLDDLNAPCMEEQAKAGNAAEKEWREAIDEIVEGLGEGYDFNRGKIQDAMTFFERCHGAANNGTNGGWCEEKLGDIRRDIAKLAEYKSRLHPNAIRRAREVQSRLRTWPVVNSWHTRPPRRPAGS